MLSPSIGSGISVIISLLNCMIPTFREDSKVNQLEAPTAIPALKRQGQKQTFMDLYIISTQGTHYIFEMQAQRHAMFDERVLLYACATYANQLTSLIF